MRGNHGQGTMSFHQLCGPVHIQHRFVHLSSVRPMSTNGSGVDCPQCNLGCCVLCAQQMQFAAPGWKMLHGASGELSDGGSYLTMVSPDGKDL